MRRALLGSAGLRAANAGLGFAVAVVLARALGAEGYGIYSTAFVVASVCAIVVQFGLPNLVMRETARAQVAGDWPRMRAVWRWATRAALLFSAGVLSVGGLALLVLSERIGAEQWPTLLLALLLVPLIALGALRAGALRGLQHVVLAQLPEMIVKPGVMLGLALMLGLMVPASPGAAMAMQLTAVAMAFALGALLLWRCRPTGLRTAAAGPQQQTVSLWKPALTMGLATGMNQFNNYTDILLLSVFHPGRDVGVYRIAYQVSILSLFGQQTIAMVLAPDFARLKAVADTATMTARARMMARLSIIPPLLILALYAAKGDGLQSLVFGDDYIGAVPAILILTLGQLMAATVAASGYILTMTGNERSYFRIKAIGAGTNIVIGLILIPPYGIFGAAISTLISLLLVNAAAWRVCHRLERIRVLPW